jgi:hypothetical protein
MQEAAVPQRQYLLGAFALFSFFANANVSAPPAHHAAHEGHVLTHVVPVREGTIGLLQIFHLLVSAAVLLSVLLPIGKSVYAHLRPSAPVVVALTTEKPAQAAPPPTPTSEDDDDTDDADTELSLSSVSGDDEPATPAPHLSAAEACILDGTFSSLLFPIYRTHVFF